jgi:YYY domain-containing protein
VIDALSFWLLVEAIGLIGVPFSALLFARLPGGGLALARPVGLLVVAYPLWLLSSLHAVQYARWSAAVSTLAVTAAGALFWRRMPGLGGADPTRLRLWLVGEALFAVSFLAWTLLRSFAPDVWQTEKPMDMAIVNSINRSDWFPPHDPWFSGAHLNYYYFGHYLVAFLVRLLGIDPAVGFNLAVSLFFALSVTSVFAVASALYLAARSGTGAPARSPVVPGLAAAGFAIAGNVAGAVQYLHHPDRFAGYDWFAPSRVIPHTANEFPFFSFLLADLHAHVMAAPFALTALAFALQLCLRGPRLPLERRRLRAWLPAAGELALGALVLGSLYALNSLDYPTAVALGALALLLWTLEHPRTWANTGVWALLWLGGSLLFFLPFWTHFAPTTHGVAVVDEHTHFSTFLKDEFLIYALPLWVVVTAFAHVLAVPFRYLVWGSVGGLVALVLLSPPRLASVVCVLSAAAFALYIALAGERPQAYRFLWLLIAASIALLGIGEFVYVRDVFDSTPSFRFNTVFKAGYQSWFLLSIVSGCVVVWNRSWLGRRVRAVWRLGLGVLLVLAAAYPIAGAYARSDGFARNPTLDGMAWLERSAPGDAAAIEWLRANVHGAPTVLEEVGPDFDPAGRGRVSTFTGLPTVLGWGGHEVQWGHKPVQRGRDVQRIYRTRSPSVAQRLLTLYHVRYVFVGSLERDDYRAAALEKFARLGTRVFSSRGTAVYMIGTTNR